MPHLDSIRRQCLWRERGGTGLAEIPPMRPRKQRSAAACLETELSQGQQFGSAQEPRQHMDWLSELPFFNL